MRRGGMQQDVHKVLNLFQPEFVSPAVSLLKTAKFYAVANIHSKILDARPLSWSSSLNLHAVFGEIWPNNRLEYPL